MKITAELFYHMPASEQWAQFNAGVRIWIGDREEPVELKNLEQVEAIELAKRFDAPTEMKKMADVAKGIQPKTQKPADKSQG